MTCGARLAVSQSVWMSLVVFTAVALLEDAKAGLPNARVSPPRDTFTFNKQIAPIIFSNCAVCHHPGGPAPFSLLTYQDVRKRAQQIALVTKIRYMPPWLPEPGYGEFLGERRLNDAQISAIQRWVEQGAKEGVPSDLPPAPKFNASWQLGQPDLIVKMPRPYTLQAEGPDVFRNFVIPIPALTTRYVKAVEILPGNKKIVHHANILIDRTRSARALEGRDQVGFAGMQVEFESERFEPDSHFLFWKPGTVPYAEPDEMAWRLDKGTDLVLNMHLRPSGKPELIQAVIGLYFSDKPPTRFPMLLQLEHDGAIDIPPGKKNFQIADDFELPLDVEVLGLYPHAHYLGKEIQGFATLPDGTKKWLIRITDWDLNWQAVYRYVKPIFLPKGTVVSMRCVYDNSADNVRNPNHPPKRVVFGNNSTDEMGHLWIQVLPRDRDGLMILQEALMRQRLQKYPNDFVAHFNLGAVLQAMGKFEEAISHFQEALQIRPDDARAQNNAGAALQAMGKLEEAIIHFREALRIRPESINARYNLSTALLAQGKAKEAIGQLREILRVAPDDADAHNDLGSALVMQGKLAEAEVQFADALRINPEHAYAHYNLGYVFAKQGNLVEAVAHLERALRLKPDDADTHNELGSVYTRQGNFVQAIAHFERALRINPQSAEARRNLQRARAQLGKN